LCRTLSSCSKTQPIPVFLVSGEPAVDTQRYCKELGAADYFEKPIDFDALRSCLARLQKQNAIPRAEVRVRLRVRIRIAGKDSEGRDFQEDAYTENVSLSGFLCSCSVPLQIDSLVEVYLMEPREQHVGKARAVRSEPSAAPYTRYGFRFAEKTGPWVLD
jgi:response regulator RpfG family c-di-GMP phosphodiesterase